MISIAVKSVKDRKQPVGEAEIMRGDLLYVSPLQIFNWIFSRSVIW